MIVGLCEIDLSIPESHSLKDKRQILRSLLDNLRNKFNISVAEVGRMDAWQRATVGIACVSNETKFTVQVLNKAMDYVRSNPRVVVVDYSIETF
jgi:uncharacterized protein YlxP (DUF503 family)